MESGCGRWCRVFTHTGLDTPRNPWGWEKGLFHGRVVIITRTLVLPACTLQGKYSVLLSFCQICMVVLPGGGGVHPTGGNFPR